MVPAIKWRPLESNPKTMSAYIKALGVTGSWKFTDVLSADPALLCMIPHPCCAFILLFPITQNYVTYCEQEKDSIRKDGQQISDNIFYMKQTIGNACGTIGVIHAIANAQDKIVLKTDSPLLNFMDKVKRFNPAQIGAALETDESFAEAHTDAAREGQTAPLSADAPLDLHFVALVHKEGSLYELDGRKNYPVNHGDSSEQSFVIDAAAVCRQFMARDPGEMRFSILALSQMD